MPPIAMTIAGSDPGGGAGIQADLKTFHQLGVYGTSAITLITVQNSRRVSRVEPLNPFWITEQIEAILEDFPPAAIKTGALGTTAAVEAIGAFAFPCPLIVDPVCVSKHGMKLVEDTAREAMRAVLLPRAALVTPNLEEAEWLSGLTVQTLSDMKRAARRIHEFGPQSVLIKGGHLAGDTIDVLWSEGAFTEFREPRILTPHTHGTGCTLSAAITALVARGLSIAQAVRGGKAFVTEAIRTAPGLGGGAGPLNHWALPFNSL